jgi:predicted  nucleic acid-binding Zn-ribbon protein
MMEMQRSQMSGTHSDTSQSHDGHYPQPYQSDTLPAQHVQKSTSRPSMSYILEDSDKMNSSLNYNSLISQKDQMRKLNKRLETYISESNNIDKDIERLMRENEILKAQLKPENEPKAEDYQDQYHDKFEQLRKEIRDLSSECNKLEHNHQTH